LKAERRVIQARIDGLLAASKRTRNKSRLGAEEWLIKGRASLKAGVTKATEQEKEAFKQEGTEQHVRTAVRAAMIEAPRTSICCRIEA